MPLDDDPTHLNPKDLLAQHEDRVPLDLLEHAADMLIARALQAGAREYGRRNFRLSPIKASTYGAAIKRHIGAWLDGEEVDPKSGLPHIAHVGANVHVILSALDAGTFIDDRAPEVIYDPTADKELLQRSWADQLST